MLYLSIWKWEFIENCITFKYLNNIYYAIIFFVKIWSIVYLFPKFKLYKWPHILLLVYNLTLSWSKSDLWVKINLYLLNPNSNTFVEHTPHWSLDWKYQFELKPLLYCEYYWFSYRRFDWKRYIYNLNQIQDFCYNTIS